MTASWQPDYLSMTFAAESFGYLSAPAAALPAMLAELPPARSDREKAIVAAIRHGIRYPEEWDKRRRPLVLRKPPPTLYERMPE
jgi:hypothetical protein